MCIIKSFTIVSNNIFSSSSYIMLVESRVCHRRSDSRERADFHRFAECRRDPRMLGASGRAHDPANLVGRSVRKDECERVKGDSQDCREISGGRMERHAVGPRTRERRTKGEEDTTRSRYDPAERGRIRSKPRIGSRTDLESRIMPRPCWNFWGPY